MVIRFSFDVGETGGGLVTPPDTPGELARPQSSWWWAARYLATPSGVACIPS
jgi:hypothetical protein